MSSKAAGGSVRPGPTLSEWVGALREPTPSGRFAAIFRWGRDAQLLAASTSTGFSL
jgi:hypothetical protein